MDDLSDFADFVLDALEEDEELEEDDVDDFREDFSCFSDSSIRGMSSVMITSSYFCALRLIIYCLGSIISLLNLFLWFNRFRNTFDDFWC